MIVLDSTSTVPWCWDDGPGLDHDSARLCVRSFRIRLRWCPSVCMTLPDTGTTPRSAGQALPESRTRLPNMRATRHRAHNEADRIKCPLNSRQETRVISKWPGQAHTSCDHAVCQNGPLCGQQCPLANNSRYRKTMRNLFPCPRRVKAAKPCGRLGPAVPHELRVLRVLRGEKVECGPFDFAHRRQGRPGFPPAG